MKLYFGVGGGLGLSVFLAFASACVQPNSVQCGERFCPAGSECGPQGDRCVYHEQVVACDGLAEGDACTSRGLPGSCHAGACDVAVCGDRIIDPSEACDDGNVDSGDGCNSSCTSNEKCGNAVLDRDEECDCGNGTQTPGAGCTGPNGDTSAASCHTDCTAHKCGDGAVEGVEQCEPGLAISGFTCDDFGYYEGAPTCNAVCQVEPGNCAKHCGDGMVNGGTELCDGAAPAGQSCLSFGFDAGQLGCTSFCAPELDECREIGWRSISPLATFRSFWGMSASDLYAGDASGRVWHWDGSGALTYQETGRTQLVTGLWGTSDSDIYATFTGNGAGGAIGHWNGTAWSSVALADLYGISGSGTTIIAVGLGGVIYMKNGTNWDPMTNDDTNDLFGVWVASATEAFAVGRGGTLLHWVSGTWNVIQAPTSMDFITVWGSSPNDVYFGGQGVLQHWNGSSIKPVVLGTADPIVAIHGTSQNDVWATAGTAVYHYDGDAWIPIDTGTPGYGIYATTAGDVFRASANLQRFRGTGWGPTTPPHPIDLIAMNDQFAVGQYGFALHHDGLGWRAVETGVSYQLLSVSGTTVVGEHGTILEWNGTKFVPQVTSNTETLTGVWRESATNAWAVGVNGVVMRNTGSGWAEVTSPTSSHFAGIWGSAGNDVYAITYNKSVVHFNGSTWSGVSSPAFACGNQFWSIHGTGAGDVWIAGDNGCVIQYTTANGWQQHLIAGGTSSLYSIYAYSPNHVVVADNSNTLNMWDGGQWSSVKPFPAGGSAFPNSYRAVWAESTNTHIMAAGGGLSLANGYVPGTWYLALAPKTNAGVRPSTSRDVYFQSFFGDARYDGVITSALTLPVTLKSPVEIGSTVFAGGTSNNGIVGRFVAGSWNQDNVAANVMFSDFSGVTDTDVWAVGRISATPGCVVAHWTGTWSASTTLGSSAYACRVWAIAGAAVVTASDGEVSRWNGSTWTTTQLGGTISAVWGSSANDIFVVGGNGRISHFDGASWSTMTSGTVAQLYGVWGFGSKDVWVAGLDPNLYHYDGTSWTPVRHAKLAGSGGAGRGTSSWIGNSSPDAVERLYRVTPW